MLKVLVKKQLTEVFKSYFFDAKKNKMRSKGAIVAWFVFFIVIVVGMLGGIFTSLSMSLCPGLTDAGMDWLYFLLMSGISSCLGVFGSVFNTYSGLYLSKDNDLLLSMPIPVRTIITARLLNVYLMGTMYSSAVLLPALIVYWITAGATVLRVLCGIVLLLGVTTFVLLLSCLLGWVVAKISLRLKNKSYITALLSLVFFGAYYVVYFRANMFIQTLVLNAQTVGAKIRGAAYVLYLFGRIGTGDVLAALVFAAAAVVFFMLTRLILSRSFLRIATASAGTKKLRRGENRAKAKGQYAALLGKELSRFVSSANYMLNCGLGILLIPATGVLLLFKGETVCATAAQALPDRPDCAAVLICTVLCMLTSLVDVAAPSVSLEGKNLWVVQSLPIRPRTVLRAKASAQLILTAAPMLLAAVCAMIVVPASPTVKGMLCVTCLAYSAFSALADTVIGVRMPLLNWTNEIVPIKQSGAVMVAIFGNWAVCILLGGLYLLVGYKLGAWLYLLIWSVLLAATGLYLLRWLDGKGSRAFDALS